MLNDAEIGAPNSLARAASSVSWSDQPYRPSAPGASRRSTWKSDRKTGICGRIGRQPASGLTPRSFWSAIIAWLMPWRSLPYCLRSLAISGWSSCMARCDLTCLTNSGNRISRTVTTRNMIDSAQVMPQAGSRNVENTECHVFITQEIAVYSQSSNGGLLLRGPARGRRGGSFGSAVTAGLRCRRRNCRRGARRVAALSGSRSDATLGHEVDAARVPGRALQQPAQRQPAPAAGAVPGDGLGGVGAAGRVEPAPRGQRRADRPRVEANQAEELARDHRRATRSPSRRSRPATRSRCSTADSASAASGRARTTRSAEEGNRESSEATTARSLRVTRWRTTELPTALPTTKPARAPGGVIGDAGAPDADPLPGCTGRSER